MPFSFRRFPLALTLAALALSTLAGCRSGSVQASATETVLSGPPTINADYGVRNPRTCAKLATKPTEAQAIALVQCNAEYINAATMWLISDVTLEMGAPRAMTLIDSDLNDLDATAKIYPLRGGAIKWSCGLVSTYGAGTNCQKFAANPSGMGRCWHTLFNDWKCSMMAGSSSWVVKQQGPTTY